MLEHYHKNDIIFLRRGLDIPHSHLLFHTSIPGPCRLYLTIFYSQSPRSAVSEPEPDSPGDSGTDLRHDSHNDVVNKDTSDDQSDMEQDDSKPTIGIRSDLLPMHPLPKDGLKDLPSLHGLPALEALRRQAGAQGNFLAGLGQSPLSSFPASSTNNRPSQPPTPQSTGSNELGGNWTFEEQFKQVCIAYFGSYLL